MIIMMQAMKNKGEARASPSTRNGVRVTAGHQIEAMLNPIRKNRKMPTKTTINSNSVTSPRELEKLFLKSREMRLAKATG